MTRRESRKRSRDGDKADALEEHEQKRKRLDGKVLRSSKSSEDKFVRLYNRKDISQMRKNRADSDDSDQYMKDSETTLEKKVGLSKGSIWEPRYSNGATNHGKSWMQRSYFLAEMDKKAAIDSHTTDSQSDQPKPNALDKAPPSTQDNEVSESGQRKGHGDSASPRSKSGFLKVLFDQGASERFKNSVSSGRYTREAEETKSFRVPSGPISFRAIDKQGPLARENGRGKENKSLQASMWSRSSLPYKPEKAMNFKVCPIAPRGYEFVPKGNVYVTRHCRSLTHNAGEQLYTVHVEGQSFKHNRLSSAKLRRVGIFVPQHIADKVSQMNRATNEERIAATATRDKRYLDTARQGLLKQFPQIPLEDAEAILAHGFLKGSGRVGRSTRLSLEEKMRCAVEAHVRHVHTDYEDLLRETKKKNREERDREKKSGDYGVTPAQRAKIRYKIASQIKTILNDWRSERPELVIDIDALEMDIDAEEDSEEDSEYEEDKADREKEQPSSREDDMDLDDD